MRPPYLKEAARIERNEEDEEDRREIAEEAARDEEEAYGRRNARLEGTQALAGGAYEAKQAVPVRRAKVR